MHGALQKINQAIISLISPNDITHWILQIKKWTCNSYNVMFERVSSNLGGQLDGLLSHWQPAFANKLIDSCRVIE